ncbi:MAG: GntR family transcriptional regulator, partial [Vicinamibacterales bacterium]
MRVGKDGRTLNTRVFEALRAAILNGDLLPGQRLKASSLARTYEVSLNVIREALNRLAGEKLVELEPQFGFAVRQLSAEDLDDLVRQRIILEGIALRQCLQRGSLEWPTFGKDAWQDMKSPVMGAEDFSYVLHRVPGAMVFLGVCPEGQA